MGVRKRELERDSERERERERGREREREGARDGNRGRIKFLRLLDDGFKVPVLMAREADWLAYESFLSTPYNQVTGLHGDLCCFMYARSVLCIDFYPYVTIA